MDPIHQFEIKNFFVLTRIGGHDIAFTNSALYMVIALGVISALMIGATASRALVPGRMQSVAEISYEFVATTLRQSAGTEGMKFFPLVFTLFMFILAVNMIGLIPYAFTVTSHIIITVSLALLVFLTVIIYGFWKQRAEILQAVRAERHPDLHPAAGHLHRDPVVPLAADLAQRAAVREHARRPHHAQGVRRASSPCSAPPASSAGSARILPLGLTVALTALEFLVAFLQAYVFAILTCIYLNDAIHPGH